MTDDALRVFLDRIERVEEPETIAKLLAELASDVEYFTPFIEPIDPGEMGGAPIHVPERGPRLFLMHRPHGVMSYVHSHGTWAVVAPIQGVETHFRYDIAEESAPGKARLEVADERRLVRGDAAVVIPPNDIHSHGHAGGADETPFTLILTGDDQLRFARREYDLDAGTYRDLPPGDFGMLNLPAVG